MLANSHTMETDGITITAMMREMLTGLQRKKVITALHNNINRDEATTARIAVPTCVSFFML